jgi:hypothetical protein
VVGNVGERSGGWVVVVRGCAARGGEGARCGRGGCERRWRPGKDAGRRPATPFISGSSQVLWAARRRIEVRAADVLPLGASPLRRRCGAPRGCRAAMDRDSPSAMPARFCLFPPAHPNPQRGAARPAPRVGRVDPGDRSPLGRSTPSISVPATHGNLRGPHFRGFVDGRRIARLRWWIQSVLFAAPSESTPEVARAPEPVGAGLGGAVPGGLNVAERTGASPAERMGLSATRRRR